MTFSARRVTCRQLVELLADHLAGELGRDERAVSEAHLAECADCLAYLRSYVQTVRLAKDAYADDDVPAGLVR